MSECLEVNTDAMRLACFDEASAQVLNKPASVVNAPVLPEAPSAEAPSAEAPSSKPPSLKPQTPSVVTVTTPTKIDEFGLNPPAPKIVENELNGNEELIDHIVSLQEREPNKWLISLAGGQVWYQANSKRFRLREGMEIRIFPSPFSSSYRLSSSTMKGYIQVKRVK